MDNRLYHVEMVESRVYSFVALLVFTDPRSPEDELVTIDISAKNDAWSIATTDVSPLLDDCDAEFSRRITTTRDIASFIHDLEETLAGWRENIQTVLSTDVGGNGAQRAPRIVARVSDFELVLPGEEASRLHPSRPGPRRSVTGFPPV